MQVVKNNVTQFLASNNTCFMIPVYQRNYDWKEENCRQLWADLWYVAQAQDEDNGRRRTHFLGTICSKTISGREKTIIDGQQRITTITLLLKAIHDYVDNDDFKHDIDSSFIRNLGFGVTPDHRVKLHLNKRDDAVYNRLLDFDSHVEESELSPREKASRIYQNYEFFYQRVSGLSMEQVIALSTALERIVIVDLDVEDENPQEIFESLNSTGLDLTDVDLLRNYLLMSLDHRTQSRLYNDYWYKIEENVHPDNMVRFFVDYLIFVKKSDSVQVRGRRNHINERNLYIAFKDYYRTLSDDSDGRVASPKVTESILTSMLRYSKAYKRLVFNANVDMNSLGDIDRIIYSIVYANQAIASRPILLYVMDKYLTGEIDHDQALEMLDACLSMTFRSKVTKSVGINGQFAGNMLQRLPSGKADDITKMFWRAITSGNGRFAFPSDKSFSDALASQKIFEILRSKGTKYLLYTLEQRTMAAKGLPRYDDPNITIEHIMPNTLTDEWTDDLGEDATLHDAYLNLLGNLTLTSNNPEMSNKRFDKKRDWYGQSSFSYTRQLAALDGWTLERIVERGEMLTEKCLATWVLPADYQPVEVEVAETKKRPRPPFRFSMIGLEEGDEISFVSDPSRVATVANDDSHVIYGGETFSLSGLAAVLLGKDNSNGIAGPLYFTYDGQTLNEIRNEIEANMY